MYKLFLQDMNEMFILFCMSYEIFQKMGGRKSAFVELERNGYQVASEDTLRMWEQRGSIPGWAILALMAICQKLSIQYSYTDFKNNPRRKPSANSK